MVACWSNINKQYNVYISSPAIYDVTVTTKMNLYQIDYFLTAYNISNK